MDRYVITKDWYPEYLKHSYKSVMKSDLLKMGKKFNRHFAKVVLHYELLENRNENYHPPNGIQLIKRLIIAHVFKNVEQL